MESFFTVYTQLFGGRTGFKRNKVCCYVFCPFSNDILEICSPILVIAYSVVVDSLFSIPVLLTVIYNFAERTGYESHHRENMVPVANVLYFQRGLESEEFPATG